MNLKRLVIHTKDIQRITGQSERRSRSFLKRMRTHFNKQAHQYITIEEFCLYSGLNPEEVATLIK
jgi:hypothetical protein